MSDEKVLTKEIAGQWIRDFRVDLSDYLTIEAEAAKILGESEQHSLGLGITELSGDVAKSLSKFRGWLWLGGLKSLSDTAAESLSRHKGVLQLPNLKTLSDAGAKSLSKHKGGTLWLGLSELSDAAAKSLGKYKGGTLELLDLRNLSDAAAMGLSKHRYLPPPNPKTVSYTHLTLPTIYSV